MTRRKLPEGISARNGRYLARVSYRDPITGWHELSAGTYDTLAEAVRARRAKLVERDRTGVTPSTVTVSALAAAWLADCKRRDLAYNTLQQYSDVMARCVLPLLGSERIQDLSVSAAAAYVVRMQQRHGAKQARLNVKLLVTLFGYGMRREVVYRNVWTLVDRPAAPKLEQQWYTAAQRDRFLRACFEAGAPWGTRFAVSVQTGLRQSEISGLQWAPYLESGRRLLHVTQRAIDKGRGERELVPIRGHKNAVRSLPVAATVRKALDLQATWLKEQRLAHQRSPVWRDLDLIFCDHFGTAPSETMYRLELRRIMAAAGLPLIRAHDLRHSFASIALGELHLPMQAVQRALGHSQLATTMDTYSHVQQAAVDAVFEAQG